MKKRGGLILSTSMLVIIVLAVIMLVLGIVLVKSIMCKAIDGVDVINEEVRTELIGMISGNNDNIALKEYSNEISRGIDYGVAFLIRNSEKTNTEFLYSVEAIDTGNCGISKQEAEKYIVIGKQADMQIQISKEQIGLIRFDIPKNAPICVIRYRINVMNEDEIYGSKNFDVKIKKANRVASTIC